MTKRGYQFGGRVRESGTRNALLGEGTALLRALAATEGLTFREWCKRNGVLDRFAWRRARRREVPLESWR